MSRSRTRYAEALRALAQECLTIAYAVEDGAYPMYPQFQVVAVRLRLEDVLLQIAKETPAAEARRGAQQDGEDR